MQIHCPICSTEIEVTEEHIGHKGRCSTCQTKFIVPADPADDPEILERGTPPEKEAPKTESQPPKVEAPASGAKAPALQKTKAPDRAPALATPPAAGSSVAAIKAAAMARKKKGGGMMPWLVMLVLLAGGGFGYMHFFGHKHDKPEGGGTSKPPKVTVQYPDRPAPAPTPTNDDPDADKPEFYPFDPSIPLDGSEFDLSDKRKEIALSYLKSDDDRKREGAMEAFRSLGDEFKGDYKELIDQARAHHLAELTAKAANLSAGDVSLDDFAKAYGEWKPVADAALAMVLTNWRTTAPDDLKAKFTEMEVQVMKAEQLFANVEPMLKSSEGQSLDSLQGALDIIEELGEELEFATGEDPPPPPDLAKIAAEATEAARPDDPSGQLTTARAAYASSEAALRHNAYVHRGTTAYKDFVAQLNKRRLALGLGALRIDDTLTSASEMHCGDMLFQDYYAHKGKDGSTYATRARAAGFKGTPTGQCISNAGPDHAAANKAWWYSDGHRSILFAKEPDAVGLGNARNYWTLVTGKLGGS